jgi:hypothetical protein
MKARLALDGVIALVQGLGFKARGATLYRSRNGAEEIVHVVYIQSGRGHLEGKFTISMGVFVPAVFRLEKAIDPPRFPHIYDCQIGTRISAFAGAGDIWWPSDDVKTLTDLEPAIHMDVPRFFGAWGERRAVLDRWKEGLPARSVVTVSPLAIAAFLCEEGCKQEAAQLLSAEFRGRSTATAANRVRQFARRLQLSLDD